LSEIFKASVKENKKITENHYLLTLHPLDNIKTPDPGQFFMLSVDSGLDPLLKRPFSLHRWLDGDFQLLYRVLGKATAILKSKRDGEVIEVLGPLGNSFPLDNEPEQIILVAGGIGIAPLLALADRTSDAKPLLYYGARTENELLRLDEFRSLGIETVISTDDGSSGHKGLITDILEEFLTSHASRVTDYRVYACGPKPMLKALSELTKKHNIKTFMALEESMACGIGTCLGCVVNTTDGYRRVCKEGPVFESAEIVW
jgi:dihydroorotate dehydrogenase electron transfer subunit